MTRLRRRQAGNAMVEFALAAGILLPCLAGIFEFGYGFYLYNRLTAGVRAGARYASLLKYDSSSESPSTSYKNAVRNTVVYGSPTGGSTPIVPGLTTSQVAINMHFDNGVPDVVKVSVSSFTVDTVFKTLQWGGKPAASFHYEGTWAPSGGS